MEKKSKRIKSTNNLDTPHNFFVSGSCGFLGYNMILRLLKEKKNVVAFDSLAGDAHNKEKLKSLEKGNRNLKSYEMPIEFADSWHYNRYKPDVVLHIGFVPRVQYSIEFPKQTNLINVQGFIELLEKMRENNCKNLVLISSSSVYGNPLRLPQCETDELNPMSPYAIQKRTCEDYARFYSEKYGFKVTILRPFNIIGPYQNVNSSYANLVPKSIDRYLKGELPDVYGSGEHRRAYTYVDDVVEAIWLSATTNAGVGETFNIGTSETHSVLEVIDIIQTLTGSKKGYNSLPEVTEPAYTQADISKAKKILGWSPKTRLEEGLKLTIEYFKKEMK